MSAAPALTPLRTTPQKPSWACPWVTISILMSLRLTSAPSGPFAPPPDAAGVPVLQAPMKSAAPASATNALFRRFMLVLLLRSAAAPRRGPDPVHRWSADPERRVPYAATSAAMDTSFRPAAPFRPGPAPLSRGSPRVARGGARGEIGRPLRRCGEPQDRQGPYMDSLPRRVPRRRM